MTASETSVARTRPDFARVDYGLLWIGLALVGMIAFYWTGLLSLVTAWARPEYSHGYLIVPIALYLFLLRSSHEPNHGDGAPIRRAPGVALVLLALAVGLLGNLVQIPDVITYGFIICIAGLVLTALGASRGLRFWAPIAYLVFMLPLPTIVYLPLSIKLQTISSELGVALISLFGVPVFLDGNIIDLGTYKLQVAEACSGLRYLFPLMSFGFLFAILYRGPIWQKVVLFLSTMPIAVLMNSFRIAVVGFLVNEYGVEQAEGFLHLFEGWVIFLACVAILYIEAMGLQQLTRNRQPIHAMLDVGSPSIFRQLYHPRSLPMSGALKFAATAILLAGIAWQLAPARAAIIVARDPLSSFPLQLGDWRGERKMLDPSTERVLAASDYLVADYAAAHTQTSLLVAYYRSQTEGSGMHSPEVCLPVGGWDVSEWRTVNTGLRTRSGKPLFVNRAVIQKSLDRELVYYWFEQRGRSLTSEYAVKAYVALDALAQGRTDGALVRVITPINPTEPTKEADNRLRSFVSLLIPTLPRYVAD